MLEERGNSTELDFVSAREVDRLSETLRREIRRRGIDPATADDLVQESWLRTLRSPPASRDGARLGGWLRVVGERLVAELRRSNRNRSTRERAAARTESVEAAASDREDSALARLVAELAEPYREVVRLRFFEGLELDEIAERLSRSPATVRSQLARGLERLRARLPEPRRDGLPAWLALGLLWRKLVSRTGRRWALAAAAVALSLAGLWFVRARTPALAAGTRSVAALEPSRAETNSASSRVPGVARQETPGPPPAIADTPPWLRTIEGRVLTDEGVPQPFAELWSSTRTGPGTPLATADARGRYRVEGLAAELFLWASAADHCPSRRVYLASIGAAGRHDLVLRATRGVLLLTLLEPDGRPAADVRVALDDQGERAPSSVITASGALEIPFGEVTGTTDASGRVTLVKPDREWLTLRASRGGRPLLELTLAAAAVDEVRELVLPRPASLAGVVVDAAGRPVAAAEVRVRQLGEVELATVSDAAGRFTVADLAPGPCGVSAETRADLASGQLVLVLAEGQRAETRIELGPQGTLVGRALDGTVPLAGARVAIFAADKRGEPEQASVTTDAEGRFRFCCTPGVEHRLELTAPGETQPCGWSANVTPGTGRELELRVEPRLRAREMLTLELLGADAEHAPTLIELRSTHPNLSFEVPVDPRTLRVALAVPPLEYELVIWSAGLGAWNHKQRLRPSPEVQRVLLPRPGVVQLDVELPEGLPDAARFEAGINVAGFNPIGFEALGALGCVREFERDASGRHLRAELYPGRHAWFVRSRGCVAETASFRVQAGEQVELHVAPTPGVELELVVELPRALRTGEALSLRAVTPRGEREVSSSGENRRLEHGFTNLLTLPADASALRAVTRFGLAGTHEFAPGELVRGTQRVRVELALRPER